MYKNLRAKLHRHIHRLGHWLSSIRFIILTELLIIIWLGATIYHSTELTLWAGNITLTMIATLGTLTINHRTIEITRRQDQQDLVNQTLLLQNELQLEQLAEKPTIPWYIKNL